MVNPRKHPASRSTAMSSISRSLSCAFFLPSYVGATTFPTLEVRKPTSSPRYRSINFAPHFRVNSASILAMTTSVQPSLRYALRYCRYGHRCSALSTLLLFAAGDIVKNPGPVRYPCRRCSRPVKSIQRGIQCEVCYFWLHANCVEMPKSEYDILASSDDSSLIVGKKHSRFTIPVAFLFNPPAFRHSPILNHHLSILDRSQPLHSYVMQHQTCSPFTIATVEVYYPRSTHFA